MPSNSLVRELTPSVMSEQAERLRRVDVAAEDVETVMEAAAMLERAGDELARVVKNRDRLMRNRNNKQQELRELREKMGEIHVYVNERAVLSDNTASVIRNILSR